MIEGDFYIQPININEDQDYINFINSGNSLIEINEKNNYTFYTKKYNEIITEEYKKRINYNFNRKLFIRKKLDIKTKALNDIKYLELEYLVRNKNYFNNKINEK